MPDPFQSHVNDPASSTTDSHPRYFEQFQIEIQYPSRSEQSESEIAPQSWKQVGLTVNSQLRELSVNIIPILTSALKAIRLLIRGLCLLPDDIGCRVGKRVASPSQIISNQSEVRVSKTNWIWSCSPAKGIETSHRGRIAIVVLRK